ncbi:MAG TPA: hypothetical protein VGH28_25640 [Polyangiaceae bacterium]|jgi:hypothetical protein
MRRTPSVTGLARLAALAVLAGALLAPAAALAGDSKAESDKLFREGLQLFEHKDFDGARAKFTEAYAKFPSPNSLLNLARSEQLSSHCVDAIAHYRAYVALPPNPRISSGDRGSAVLKMNECYTRIGRIDVKAPLGAHVSLDGLAVSWNPGEPIDVPPGAHRIDLAVGNAMKTRSVSPNAGEIAQVDWEDPAPPPPTPVVTPPTPVPEVKTVEPPPPPVVVAPPTPEPKPVTWTKTSHWPTGKVVTAVGLGVLAVGSFIAAPSFLAASLSNARDADALATKLGSSGCTNAQSPDCLKLAGERSDQSTFGALSATFFVFGTLFAVGAIVAVVAWPNVHPLVSASRDGLLFRF